MFEVEHGELWKLLEAGAAGAAGVLEGSSGTEGLTGRVEAGEQEWHGKDCPELLTSECLLHRGEP